MGQVMPALPFFTAIPSQASSTPSAGPLTPASSSTNVPQTASDVAQGGAYDSAVPMPLPADTSTDASQSGLSFWQTFQQTKELTDLANGQEFAELTPLLPVDTDQTLPLPDSTQDVVNNPWMLMPISAELTDENAPTELGLALQSRLSAPVNEITVEQSENPSLVQIESQRIAMPLYQAAEQGEVMNPHALKWQQSQSQMGMTQTPLAPQTELPADIAPNRLTESHPMFTNMSQSTEGELMSEEGELGIELGDMMLEEKTVNLHEKPLTLQSKETALKPQLMTQVEAVQGDNPDIDGLISSTSQSSKEALSQSKLTTETNINQGPRASAHFKLDVPPQSPQWSEQIAQRITIMSNEHIQSARIQLDPPELGLLEIKIRVQQDQVNVAFASNHQAVRDALETQAPRLKELMEQQGVDLGDVNVSDHGQQQTAQQEFGDGSESSGESADGEWANRDSESEESITTLSSDSLIDDFA